MGLRYEEFNWDYARPSKEDDPDCLPCLFLQFLVVENGTRVSKMLQVFSKQVKLMDKLITIFVNDTNTRLRDEADNGGFENQNGNENGKYLVNRDTLWEWDIIFFHGL